MLSVSIVLNDVRPSRQGPATTENIIGAFSQGSAPLLSSCQTSNIPRLTKDENSLTPDLAMHGSTVLDPSPV
jgi:hypothetical protein